MTRAWESADSGDRGPSPREATEPSSENLAELRSGDSAGTGTPCLRVGAVGRRGQGTRRGSRWVWTVVSGSASATAFSTSSARKCPRSTVHPPGTSTVSATKRCRPDSRVRSSAKSTSGVRRSSSTALTRATSAAGSAASSSDVTDCDTSRNPVTRMFTATSAATTGSRRCQPVSPTSSTPTITPAEVQTSVNRCFPSAGVIVGVLLVGLTGWQRLDPVVAALVAVNILVTGFRLVSQSVTSLLDAALPAADVARVSAVLDERRTPEVDFAELRTRESGRHRFVALTVLVPGGWTVERGHFLADDVEKAVAEPGCTAKVC